MATPRENKFLITLVRKTVTENTHQSFVCTTDHAKQLNKYLSNEDTVDIVFDALVERCELESQNSVVVTKCIDVAKNNLSHFPPGLEALAKLDRFCHALIAPESPHASNSSVHKSVEYMIAVITKHLDSLGPEATERWTGVKRGSPVSIAPPAPSSAAVPAPVKVASAPANAVPAPAAESAKNSEDPLIANFADIKFAAVRERLGLSGGKPAGKTARSLLDSIFFGGQFNKGDEKQPEVDVDDSVNIGDSLNMQSSVMIVRENKISEMKILEGDHLARNKNAPKLFNYKFYADQTPLQMSKEETNKIIDTLTAPKKERKPQVIAASSNVMIKLICDIYRDVFIGGKSHSATDQVLSFFLEMLDSPQPEARIHAFNLLFNLSVHINLFEDGNAVFSEKTQMPRTRIGETDHMRAIQQDLYEKCVEMALYLLHNDEEDVRVWNTVLTCWLMFVTSKGKIERTSVMDLDIRILAKFVKISMLESTDEDLHRKLILLLVNSLYDDPNKLNQKKLHRIGGIRFILDQYTFTHSLQARRNIFCVVFDTVVLSLGKRKEFSEENVGIVFELLRRIEAPWYLAQIFKFLPDKFVEVFVKFLFFDLLLKDPSLSPIKQKVDRSFMVAFMYELEKLSANFLKMKPEFETRSTDMMKTKENQDENLKTLRALLTSDNESERRNGEAWLFVVLKIGEEKGWPGAALKAKVEALSNELCRHPDPRVRRIYLSVTEKMMLRMKSRIEKHGDEAKVKEIIRLVNDNLGKLVSFGEKNQTNLLAMLYIIMDFVCALLSNISEITDSSVIPGGSDPELVTVDGLCNLFLQGNARISGIILSGINITILHHIFVNLKPSSSNLTPSTSRQNRNNSTIRAVRTTLLMLIARKCDVPNNKELIASIGGMSFFKDLIKDPNPLISFHSATFLMERLHKDRPAVYTDLTQRLTTLAQQTHNDKLLGNAYLQYRNICDVFQEVL